MLKRAAITVVILAIVGAALGWFLTAPEPLEAAQLPAHEPDIANGERMFYVGGCESCHAAADAKGEDKLKLGGGRELDTEFGIFRVPNISPDPETGIGNWTTLEFANAVVRGVTPGGSHFYPAFPYPSYTRMKLEDVIDLQAFLRTLPPISNQVAGHSLKFPFSIRRAVGVWKFLYFSSEPVMELAGASDAVLRGQYLVEGPGHCAECHTSRDLMGGLKTSQWMAGAPDPEGEGKIPNITPDPEDGLTWSEKEIVDTFETGFTPEFDTLGGSMSLVQWSLAHLPKEDLEAIAAYLKAIPPLPDAVQGAPKS